MKKQSSFQQTPPFDLRPASVEEAGLFYSNDERDEALGTVGHLRMDFGSGGKGFYHTWTPIAGTTEARLRKTTASTGLLRRQNITDFACGVPQDQGIIKGICIATTCVSRRWPGRRNWWAE